MNKNETDYSQGKIYKIISDLTDRFYIGSSKQYYLCDRLGKHKYEYKLWKEGNKKYISSFELLELEHYKIILIENFPCNSREELQQREQYYIDKYKCDNLVNIQSSYISQEDRKEKNRLRQLNRSKDKKQEENKKFRLNNEERVKEINNKSYHKNKDKYHIKITCECGCEVIKTNLNRHFKSKKHIKLIAEK